MILDITSFEKALIQLEESMMYCQSDLAKNDAKLGTHLRAAAIQAFEFTYELSFKMLKRYLEMTEPNPNAIDEMSFANIIRLANERGLLLSGIVSWKKYREERGATRHAYNEAKAEEVFSHIEDFMREAIYLSIRLTEKIKNVG